MSWPPPHQFCRCRTVMLPPLLQRRCVHLAGHKPPCWFAQQITPR